VSRDSIGKTNE
jgi:phosphatidylinositol 4-kinase